MKNINIAFIGAGNLTRAIVGGLIIDKFDSQRLWVSNPSQTKLDFFSNQFGIHTTLDNCQAVKQADVVILAAKALRIPGICEEIKNSLSHHPLIISVAVGTTNLLLDKWLGSQYSIVRAIPNTPAVVGAGATGLYACSRVSEDQKNMAEAIFRSVGMSVWVEEENQLDWVCAVSGCGPGYMFLIMESIEEAVAKIGLVRKDWRLLIAQTMLGAARLALESDQSLAELRQHVASPKGTTEQAIRVLEEGKLRQLLAGAIEAAVHRAKEIEKLLTSSSES